MTAASVILNVLSWYAPHQPRGMRDGVNLGAARIGSRRGIWTAAVFLISIPLAFINVQLAQYSWMLIIVARVMLPRRSRSRVSRVSRV
jgi:hypothetical protein